MITLSLKHIQAFFCTVWPTLKIILAVTLIAVAAVPLWVLFLDQSLTGQLVLK
jgi:hypothetical protein